MGISFLGTAFSEPTLIRLASGFEAVANARILPTPFKICQRLTYE